MVRFYTTGYAGKDFADLKPLLNDLDAMLIDIRFYPNSRTIQWRKEYLQLLLKEKYRHVVHLGNRTFREGKISIQNMELGIKIVSSLDTNVVLLCGCPELKNCHRFIISEELRRRGIETEELSSWQLTNPPSLF